MSDNNTKSLDAVIADFVDDINAERKWKVTKEQSERDAREAHDRLVEEATAKTTEFVSLVMPLLGAINSQLKKAGLEVTLTNRWSPGTGQVQRLQGGRKYIDLVDIVFANHPGDTVRSSAMVFSACTKGVTHDDDIMDCYIVRAGGFRTDQPFNGTIRREGPLVVHGDLSATNRPFDKDLVEAIVRETFSQLTFESKKRRGVGQ